MGFSHTLVQYSTAFPTDEILQTVTKHSMKLEGYQSLTLLSALTDIFGSTVLTLCNRQLCHGLFSFLCLL